MSLQVASNYTEPIILAFLNPRTLNLFFSLSHTLSGAHSTYWTNLQNVTQDTLTQLTEYSIELVWKGKQVCSRAPAPSTDNSHDGCATSSSSPQQQQQKKVTFSQWDLTTRQNIFWEGWLNCLFPRRRDNSTASLKPLSTTCCDLLSELQTSFQCLIAFAK